MAPLPDYFASMGDETVRFLRKKPAGLERKRFLWYHFLNWVRNHHMVFMLSKGGEQPYENPCWERVL